MASQGFSFPPPPPPPPPQQQQQQHQQAPGHSNSAPSYGHQNAYSQRGGHRGPGSFNRGRGGRGGMNRGGRGGGGYSNNNYRSQQQGSYTGYPPAPAPSAGTASNYYQNAAHQQSQSYPPLAQPYPHTAASTYSHTNYDSSYRNVPEGRGNGPNLPTSAQSTVYGNNIPPQPNSSASRGLAGPAAAVMAPPMHWGYDSTGTGGFYTGSTNGTNYNPSLYQGSTHGNLQKGSGYKKSGHKRAFSSAFEKPTTTVPRPPAPPAVPSFGVPLPAKPPQPADASRKIPKKKKRKFNQLGLTPKTEEHESSAEEDDVDEEARLASAGNPAGILQFTYRGRTSTLKTASEIQAWIEERKKRFPTKARVEEKKKAQEESRRQRELQREEARRKHQEAKAQKEQAKHDSKGPRDQAVDPMDAAHKAKLRAEKLRKKLMKEERRLQKAEAVAEQARLRAEASQQKASSEADGQESGMHPTATDSAQGDANGVPPLADNPEQTDIKDNISSESDISSDDVDSDDDDDAPEQVSSRREGPERVPPPARGGNTKRKKLCHNFQRRGRCPRGDQCRFSHELPEAGDKPNAIKASGTRQPARRGLFQMLVKQEIEERDRQVMQAISWLGSQGLLEEPVANIATSGQPAASTNLSARTESPGT